MKTYVISSDSEDETLVQIKKKTEEKNDCAYDSLLKPNTQQCEFCDDVFQNRYDLICHNVSHIIIPLLKQQSQQCKHCYKHFMSTDELISHITKYHLPDISKHKNGQSILKSPSENQAVVECEDDLSLSVVKSNINKNNINTHKERKLNIKNHDVVREIVKDVIASKGYHDDGKEVNNCVEAKVKLKNGVLNIAVDNNVLVINRDCVGNEVSTSRDNVENVISRRKDCVEKQVSRSRDCIENNVLRLKDFVENNGSRWRACVENDLSRSRDCVENNVSKTRDCIENDVSGDGSLDNIKIVSVTSVKDEPLSSQWLQFEEDKEPVRNRLLFEEDIENTLFDNLSTECDLNIEALCKEVFGEELSEDETILEELDGGINDFEDVIKQTGNVTEENDNLLQTDVEGKENEILDMNSDLFSQGSHRYGLGMTYVGDKQSNNIETAFNRKDVFGKSVHYDMLIKYKISTCRYCTEKFRNKFRLIQHEASHMRAKQVRRPQPLCLYCERYIAGNFLALRDHISQQHPTMTDTYYAQPTRVCTICNFKYFNYQKHLKNYHPNRWEEPTQKDAITSKLVYKATAQVKEAFISLCDLCFSFMKVHIKNRANYEMVGTKTKMGARQPCDKCNNKFFTVNVVKRKCLRKIEEQKVSCVSNGNKCLVMHAKPKALTNKERLLKIQQRLKMMKR